MSQESQANSRPSPSERSPAESSPSETSLSPATVASSDGSTQVSGSTQASGSTGASGSTRASRSAEAEPLTPDHAMDADPISVVGVGASAGGLEALEEFCGSLAEDIPAAIVVLQHLSPDFKSHMDEVLGRSTQIPISVIEDGMAIEPRRIYLNPPRCELTARGGRFKIHQPADGMVTHPIDTFFVSAADNFGESMVAVILSGTGSDGTSGSRQIEQAGGLVLAQDSDSAKFDGMPSSVAAAGLVAARMPPRELADAVGDFVIDAKRPSSEDVSDLHGIERLFELLYERFGIDFSKYKDATVGRRLQRRIDLTQSVDLSGYLSHLDRDAAELDELYSDLLIGVTRFFRDAAAFDVLQQQIIPSLFERRGSRKPIRIWIAGCATGEEAYSLAILIDEEANRRKVSPEIKMFATDAHPRSLATAAAGVYDADRLEGLSPERRRKYFISKRDGFHIHPDIRRMVVFAQHNVMNDTPFTQMDLVTCRNMLIYLQPPSQAKVIALLHFALKTSGVLFLGPSERPGGLEEEFTVIDARQRLYRKRRDARFPLEATPRAQAAHPPRTMSPPTTPKRDDALLDAYDLLLSRKLPPSILVDEDDRVIHIFGGAERFLRYRGGRQSASLAELVRPELRSSIIDTLGQAQGSGRPVVCRGLEVELDNGREMVDISVEPLTATLRGVRVKLVEWITRRRMTADESDAGDDSDGDSPDDGVAKGGSVGRDADGSPVVASEVDGQFRQRRIEALEGELRFAQENLQASVEEMETTNEELQATNEELTASNEELQATNEELHSVNEELFTVNSEGQRRVDELIEATDDMDNLLATTRVGVIFLDRDLFIRRYTPAVARLFHLMPQDVGRSIEGFVHHLNHPSLIDDLRGVLEHEREHEVQITISDGTPFLLRLMPYRMADHTIDGVVMTMIDVTRLNEANASLRRFQYMVDQAIDMYVLLDDDGAIQYANPSFRRRMGMPARDPDDSHGSPKRTLLADQVTIVDPAAAVTVGDNGTKAAYLQPSDAESLIRTPGRHQIRMLGGDNQQSFIAELTTSRIEFDGQRQQLVVIRDVTERVTSQQQLSLQFHAIESALDGILIVDMTQPGEPVTYANQGFYRMTGYSPEETIGQNCRFLQGPDTNPDTVRRIRQGLRAGERMVVEILNYRRGGQAFWNELQLTPIHDADDRVTHYVGVQHDITKQREVEDNLRRASESKSEFLANISHELRTPLTAVLGFAEMLQSDLQGSQAEQANSIYRNGHYLLTLLNDLLDLSKVEAGKLSIESQSVETINLVRDVAELMGVRARQEGVPLSFVYKSAVPRHVTGDHVRLRQVLVNLIGNALKFTDHGEVTVEIRLAEIQSAVGRSAEDSQPTDDVAGDGATGHNSIEQTLGEVGGVEDQKVLQFAVRDTGIGIPETVLDQLFTPFFRGTAEAGTTAVPGWA